MTFADLGIKFDSIGIGSALAQNKLVVPLNQRSYAWEQPHVRRLYEDFSAAIGREQKTYFLGTIVLAHGEDGDKGRLLVADGQQRLATTSILIAAIRDYLFEAGANERRAADKYTADYLLEYDEFENDSVGKLHLNTADNDYFLRSILLPPDDEVRAAAKPKGFSHDRIRDAAELARLQVENIVSTLPKQERSKRLFEWIRFLSKSVVVIVIQVPRHIDAYKMFETLNDRGLRASQIDILKNFLFSEAKEAVETEIQPRWASMVGVIESIGDDELLLNYVRHFWITRDGPTTEDKLAERFKESIKGRRQVVEIITSMEEQASDYVALLTPLEHPKFVDYGKDARQYLTAISNLLGISQIRPLLLAIIRNFDPAEAKKAFEQCLSWSVRFLIAGGGGGGVLDRHYGLRAQEVTKGQIKTAKALAAKMAPYVATDTKFQEAFARASVSKNVLARYYLHSLENYKSGERKPQIGYFESPENSVNLEHIMPDKPRDNWPISIGDAQVYHKRLGNMVLLSARENSKLGVQGFDEKRKIYKNSPFLLTQDVAGYTEWGGEQIDARQAELAELAPKVWHL